jgi:hypothetical protein
MDDISGRYGMEASENTGGPRRGAGGAALHRVDPDRVAETLSAGASDEGFARLHLMVNTIFDRLVAVDPGRGR